MGTTRGLPVREGLSEDLKECEGEGSWSGRGKPEKVHTVPL